MKETLTAMRDSLQSERKMLVDRLNEIETDLRSIERVLELADRETKMVREKREKDQFSLLPPGKKEGRFKGLTFSKALDEIFSDNPDRMWTPIEITRALLAGGFKTEAKKFSNSVRTMLGFMRKKNKIHAIKGKAGWIYGPKTEEKERAESSHDIGSF